MLNLFGSVSYIEIYNERVFDLLNKRNELKIQEVNNGETSVNCVEKIVNCEDSIMSLITEGNKEKKVAETNMNTQSSRSHTIFTIVRQRMDRDVRAKQLIGVFLNRLSSLRIQAMLQFS